VNVKVPRYTRMDGQAKGESDRGLVTWCVGKGRGGCVCDKNG
jgi:hypothetical protein